MNELLLVGVVGAWLVVLMNLLLTLRLIRWVESTKAERRRLIQRRPQLVIGSEAPHFRARTLAGDLVTDADYSGRRVAFVFSSPVCSTCRDEMPALLGLAPLASRNGGVELVIVSESGIDDTRLWIDTIREEDGVDVTLPVLCAAPAESYFFEDYNPDGNTPFFCLIGDDGRVEARSLLVEREWIQLRRSWQGVQRLAPWMARSP